MLDSDLQRRQALLQLLSLPDAPELRRGHYLTVEGRADRHQLIHKLANTFIQHYLMDLEERSGESSADRYRLFTNHTAL